MTRRTPAPPDTSDPAPAPDPAPDPAPAGSSGRVVLDPDQLNMGDMMRARRMFAARPEGDPWAGANPWTLVGGPAEERNTVIIWCVRSRTDPAFTWEQAMAVPFGELDSPEEPPLPQIPEPSTPGEPSSGSDTTPDATP